MSICKTLANSLGHDLNFNSIHKKGTKFKLVIKCLQEEDINNIQTEQIINTLNNPLTDNNNCSNISCKLDKKSISIKNKRVHSNHHSIDKQEP